MEGRGARCPASLLADWRPPPTQQPRPAHEARKRTSEEAITTTRVIASIDVEMDPATSEEQLATESEREPVVRLSLMRGISRNWWIFMVRGLLAIAFGLAALIWPDITLVVLVVLFGAYAVVDGIISVVFGLTGRDTVRWWMVFWGLVGVAVGIAVFLAPGIGALALVYVIAAWAILTGAMKIAAAITWRREIHNEWVLIVAGSLSVLVGGALAVAPGAGALALIWLIGAYAVVFGVLLLIVGFRLRDLQEHVIERT